jgi:hypothetical protein
MIEPTESAPIQYPRTKADGMAELALSFAKNLESEIGLVGLARHEPRLSEAVSTDMSPRYKGTPADGEAETRADKAWEKQYPSGA